MKNLLFVLLIAAVVSVSLCQDADDLPLDDPVRCTEKPVLISICRARHQRFYYKSETNECIEFFYGGCGASANIFQTRKDCEKVCKKL